MKLFGLSQEQIQEIVKSGNIRVAVFGMGSVGLPIAVAYALRHCKVIGVDIDRRKVEMINNGINYLPHEPGLEKIPELVKKGYLKATTDGSSAASEADVIIILVPVGIDSNGKPTLHSLISAAKTIGKGLRKDSLVILETTVPPGTTEGILRRILERESGLKAGEDFALAFSPERVKAGTVIKDFLENYPKIVGGINEKSTEAVAAFYSAIINNKVIKVSNPRVAELAKLFKGAFRYVNIALADEYALICELLGVDVNEVINVANTEPYSMIHHPGPGVGGHCIPVYPYFLDYILQLGNSEFRLFRTARMIDLSMAKHVIYLLFEALNEAGRTIKGSTIAILGLAFRGDVKVAYRTPARPIIEQLRELGANVIAHDPFYTPEEIHENFNVRGAKDLNEALSDADAIIIVTDHTDYKRMSLNDFISLSRKKPVIIVDTRNIIDLKEVFMNKKDIIYRGIGRGRAIFRGTSQILEKYWHAVLREYKISE
ncbi:MAG: nucleotide sugar dehydrogenase [Candidatus Njordarchaeales archaeon]